MDSATLDDALCAALDACAREELLELIHHLAREEEVTAARVRAWMTRRAERLDLRAHRAQLRDALNRLNQRGATRSLAEVLRPHEARAEALAAQGAWHDAATLWHLLDSTLARKLDDLTAHDEDAEEIAFASTERHLSALLDALTKRAVEAEEREDVIRTLWRVLGVDIKLGGGSLDIVLARLPGALLDTERALVAGLVTEQLGTLQRGGWSWRALVELRLALDAGEMDDDAFIQLCRDAGLIPRAVARLLSREREEEALELWRAEIDEASLRRAVEQLTAHDDAHDSALTIALLQSLTHHEHAPLARLATGALLDALLAAESYDDALEIAREALDRSPDEETLARVHHIAWLAGRWAKVEREVLGLVRKREPAALLLWYMECCMEDAAIKLWRAVSKRRLEHTVRTRWLRAEQEFAEELADTNPTLASEITLHRLGRTLDVGDAGSRREAVRLLGQLRTLHTSSEDPRPWQARFEELAAQDRRLAPLVSHLRETTA